MTSRPITTRRIIDVVPPPTRDLPDRVEVRVCLVCGAVVFDEARHARWHQGQEGATP